MLDVLLVGIITAFITAIVLNLIGNWWSSGSSKGSGIVSASEVAKIRQQIVFNSKIKKDKQHDK
jgi:hypothetical protein